MDILTSLQTTYSKFIDFTGRATRQEFWTFAIFFIIGMTVSYIVDFYAGTLIPSPYINSGIFSTIFALVSIVPYISVGVRRLRDAGFNPFLYLLTLIPAIGNITLIILWLMPTKKTV